MNKIKIIIMMFILYIIVTPISAQYDKLHDFTTNSHPRYSALLIDGIWMYGMTAAGSMSGDPDGYIFKIKKDGTGGYTTLHSFSSSTTTNGDDPQGSLITDGTYLYGMTYSGGTNDLGIIFKIGRGGAGFTILHSFSAAITDGKNPYGSLITDGTYLFGMTKSGGTDDKGVIFKIELDGTNFELLHSFDGSNDGENPYGSLITDGTKLYGMTHSGGTKNFGTIFKISTTGTDFTVLRNFNNTTINGANPYGSLITDGTNLYGMTYSGGTNDLGVIFKIGKGGAGFTILHSFSTAITNGKNPYGSLILDETFLYGMTLEGGTGLSGVIFTIAKGGTGFTILHSCSKSDGNYPYGSLTTDGTYLYGMTSIGGANDEGTIFRLGNYKAPEIKLMVSSVNIPDGSNFNFDDTDLGSYTDAVFTIKNKGRAELTLTTPLAIGGTDVSQFSVQAQPASSVTPSGSTNFTVRFSPTSTGDKTATIAIANNDSDENPYNITLNGTGINPNDYSDAPSSFGSASHTYDSNIHLGISVTGDAGDYGSGDASGDIDDGVISFETWVNGTAIGPGYLPDGSTGSVTMDDDTYAVLVKATNSTGTDAQLVGWIDWNRNNVFDDPSERSITVLDGVTGNVPTGSDNVDVVIYWDGQTKNGTVAFARFRLTTDASFKSPTSPSPIGSASDGEVEDYQVPDGALPVELVSFISENTLEGVLCKWITESEIENLGFLLERKTEDTDWKEIASYKTDGNLMGQGTTSAPNYYEYLDKLVQPNTTYDYRLADVDYNGVITYHSVRTVTVEQTPLTSKLEEFTVLPAYPNPFNPSTTITYFIPSVVMSGSKQSPTDIAIYDITGKLITTLFNGEQTQGWHSIKWNGTNQFGGKVPAGIYLSKITSNEQTKTAKLMLLK